MCSALSSRSWTCGSRRLLLVAPCLLALLPCLSLGQGKGAGIEVRAVSPVLQNSSPGTIVSLSFRVTNQTQEGHELTQSLDLPDGWRLIAPPTSFALRPGEATARVTAFSIPRDTPEGEYEVTFSAHSQRDYAVQDSDAVRLIVPAVTQFALLVEQRPDQVVAGDTYQATIRAVNQGNARVDVRLAVKTEDGYPAELDGSEISLLPRGSHLITLSVKTDARETHARQHVVQIAARVTRRDGSELESRATIVVAIISRRVQEPDLRHRIPGWLTLRAVGQGGKVGLQAEVSGSGTTDEAGRRQIDFLLRGPDAVDYGVFGLRDEYWLSYRTPSFDVQLGDQGYGLSRLTGYYEYGRGAGFSARPSTDVELGAYRLGTRWEQPARSQTGAYVGTKVGSRARVRLNYLRTRQDPSAGQASFADSLLSVEARVRPSESISVSAEVGTSTTTRSNVANDVGYRVDVTGRIGAKTRYFLSKTYAGPDYPGYYSDADYTIASISFPVGPRVQGVASYQTSRQNLAQRPSASGAPEERLYRTGLEYRFPSDWYLSAGYDGFGRRDLLAPAQSAFQERALRLGVGRSTERYDFRVETRVARQTDAGVGPAAYVPYFIWHGSYRPNERLDLDLWGTAAGGAAHPSSRLLGFGGSVGIGATWTPRESTTISAFYRRDTGMTANHQIDLRASYTLNHGQSWTLQARRGTAPWARGRDTSYVVAYSVPFDLPVGRKKTVGAITGRIHDGQDDGGPGIADVVVRLGGAVTATGPKGEFAFADLAPGTYSLTVDPGSVAPGRVVAERIPIVVEVHGGRKTRIELTVVEGARLSGTVRLLPASPPTNGGAAPGPRNGFAVGDPFHAEDGGPARGLPEILIEISNGAEVLRRVTDSDGAFAFEGLRAGKWHLTVYEQNVPSFHDLDMHETDIVLGPGEAARIDITAVPRARQLHPIGETKAAEIAGL